MAVVIWLRASSSVERNERGEPVAVGVVQDVTESAITIQKLQATEARFRALIDGAPVAIGVGRDGRTLWVNPTYRTMFGLTDDLDVEGQSVSDQVAPDSAAMLTDILATTRPRRAHTGQLRHDVPSIRRLNIPGTYHRHHDHVARWTGNSRLRHGSHGAQAGGGRPGAGRQRARGAQQLPAHAPAGRQRRAVSAGHLRCAVRDPWCGLRRRRRILLSRHHLPARPPGSARVSCGSSRNQEDETSNCARWQTPAPVPSTGRRCQATGPGVRH